MNFYKYLESRYVTSQLALNRKQTTSGHGENHAILAWMWVTLKATTAFYCVTIFTHYIATLLHLATRPRPATVIVSEAKAAAAAEAEKQEKFVKEMVAQATKDRAEQGLDELARKGTA